MYNKDLDRASAQQLQQMSLHEGQLTWFSPNWYQTVRALRLRVVVVLSDRTCIDSSTASMAAAGLLVSIHHLHGVSWWCMHVQHQLENSSDDFCCSINGFQYGEDDDVCWPFMSFKVGTRVRSMRSPMIACGQDQGARWHTGTSNVHASSAPVGPSICCCSLHRDMKLRLSELARLQGKHAGDVHDFEAVSDFEFVQLRAALLEELGQAKAADLVAAQVGELSCAKMRATCEL